jgi:hypothetical protein
MQGFAGATWRLCGRRLKRAARPLVGLAAAAVIGWCAPRAEAAGDRLAWTGGVTQIEGAAGGGLVPWALIGGLETDTEVGATAFGTYVHTGDFTLRAGGASLDLDDRLELSFARQRFDAGAVLPGLTLGQDIVGAKVRLAGDAVFAPDRLLPQIALGAQWKRTLDFNEVPRAVGAVRGSDVDLYLAATKLFFDALGGRNVIVDATLRRTRANQFGLLGFGAADGAMRYEPEVSAGIWLVAPLLLGAEYRRKPDELNGLREDAAKDVFLAWGPRKSLTVTLAWVDLGDIAGKTAQRGVYASLWVGI